MSSPTPKVPFSETLPPFRTRLHKFLASAGVASRRQSEQLMLEGRVTVDNQEIRDLGYMVEPSKQKVRVDGELVHEQPKHYYIINKPTGYVCTHDDPDNRPRAIDLVPIHGLALFTVGRLDEDSEGLLLVTNDGQLAEKLAHPRFKAERVYRVQVAGNPTPAIFDQLKEGLYFDEGKFRVRRVKALKTQGRSTWLELVLTEGRNREIRRLLARVGHKVLHLQRVAFGPIRLGSLPPGEFRVLSARELVELKTYAADRRRKPRPSVPGKSVAGNATAGANSEGTSGQGNATGAPARRGAMSGPRPRRPGGGGRPRFAGGEGGGRRQEFAEGRGGAGGSSGRRSTRGGARVEGNQTGGRPPRGRKPPRGPRPAK